MAEPADLGPTGGVVWSDRAEWEACRRPGGCVICRSGGPLNVVAAFVQPIKMNYEIHGNTLPHLHVHLFPRQPDDPFVGGPVDPRLVRLHRTSDDIAALGAAIRGGGRGAPPDPSGSSAQE